MTDTQTSPFIPVFAPATTTFVRGQGTELWDDTGKRYLDFLGGLAVISLGHANPAITDALTKLRDCSPSARQTAPDRTLGRASN